MFYLAQQIKPNCGLCYYNIGNSLFVRGQYKKAIRCWLRTSELEPTHPQINYRIAQAYFSDGDIECCRKHFLAELRINPGDIDVIFDFGLFLLETGDIESAKEKFNRILELDPNFAAALFYLGEIAFNRRDFKQAVVLFSRALQKDNTLAGPCYRLAQHALMKDQQLKARAYLVSELETCPEDADTLVSIGSMFLNIGEVDYATHCLLRAVDIDCANADAYYYLGNARAMKSEFRDAAEFFVHALDIRGNHIPTLRDSALVYLAMGKLTHAARSINKARLLAPDDPQLKELGRQIFAARIKKRVADILSRFGFRHVSKKVLR
jgi:tetratricopeptide (TPR) repeat protein